MSSVQESVIAVPDAEVLLPPCDLYSDEPPLETDLHLQQIVFLLECLNWLWRDRTAFDASANSTIYLAKTNSAAETFAAPTSLSFWA